MPRNLEPGWYDMDDAIKRAEAAYDAALARLRAANAYAAGLRYHMAAQEDVDDALADLRAATAAVSAARRILRQLNEARTGASSGRRRHISER